MNQLFLKKGILLLVAIVLPICYLLGQEDLRSSTYQAYLDSNIDKWETALNEDQVKPLSLESQYDRAIAIFGYAGLCIDSKEKKRAKAYVHELHDITSELLNQQPQNPKIMGIHAASLGFKLIYQPHKMMKLGPQSVRLLEAARKIDDRCPEVLVQLGNQSWVMPRVFGGDKEEAMHYYRLAITHLEKNQEQIVENWHYIKMQMVLADWYEQAGYNNRAKSLYLKVLRLEPGFELAQKRLKLL